MAIMSFQALLFCPDEKTARVVTQVLSELDFNIEASNEPFAAVKKLMGQHYAAIVVDCDNEQNAALLFKSARNSATNASCLFVAVVEGQSGVAKAFRIGANLVLTKPINIEQSKSTLRVARGLLRKAEASKAAAPVAPPSPSVLTPTPLVPSHTPAAAPGSSAFEYQAEPEPEPDPAEATLLEYMDSVPSAADHPSQSAKQFPWQPAPSLREPMASALRRAAEAAGKTEFGAPTPASTGAAAAPAPAKQKPAMPLEFRPPTGSGSAQRGEEMVEKPLPAGSGGRMAEAGAAAPTFSSLGTFQEQEDSDAGAGKKKLLAVAVALVAALGYFGWSRIETSRHPAETRALSTPNLQPPVEAPPATASPMPETTAPAPADTQAEASPPPAAKSEDLSTVSSSKPSAGKPSASSPAAAAAPSKAEARETTQEPLIVKSGTGKSKAADTAEESVQPPAVIAAASPDEKTLSGIVSAAPASVVSKPAQLTVKISQGVSQGLLVKKVQPLYPASAKELHLEGTVEVLATITKDGNVSSTKLLKGDSILGRAAIDAVRQWKYKPYYLNNDPVEVQTQVTVNFKLP
jgi:TonB family protein